MLFFGIRLQLFGDAQRGALTAGIPCDLLGRRLVLADQFHRRFMVAHANRQRFIAYTVYGVHCQRLLYDAILERVKRNHGDPSART